MSPRRDRNRPGGTNLTQMKDRAAKFITRGDWYNALRALLVARDLAPNDTYIARKLGDVYQRLGRVDDAVEAYKDAARLYTAEGFLYKAISVNKIVLTLQPDDKEVLDTLSTLHSQRHRHRSVHLDAVDLPASAASSKVIGLYLDSLTKETMPWFPLLSDLLEEEVNLVFDMMARKKKRLHVLKRVDFEYGGEGSFAYSRDLSASGMYLRTNTIVPEDTRLEFAIRLADGEEPVRVLGEVARTTPRGEQKGFGVRFDQDGQDEGLQRVSAFVLETLHSQALQRLEENPGDVNALYDLADISREQQDLERTEAYLRRITAIESPSIAHGYLGEVVLNRALESGDENLLKEANDLFGIAAQLDHGEVFESIRKTLKERAASQAHLIGEASGESAPPVATGPMQKDESLSAFVASLEERERALDARESSLEEREDLLLEREEELEQAQQQIERRQRTISLWAEDLQRKEKALIQRTLQAEQPVPPKSPENEPEADG